jgi:hypothetical protein
LNLALSPRVAGGLQDNLARNSFEAVSLHQYIVSRKRDFLFLALARTDRRRSAMAVLCWPSGAASSPPGATSTWSLETTFCLLYGVMALGLSTPKTLGGGATTGAVTMKLQRGRIADGLHVDRKQSGGFKLVWHFQNWLSRQVAARFRPPVALRNGFEALALWRHAIALLVGIGPLTFIV